MNNRTCSVSECARNYYGNGMCNMHYQRLRRTGTTDQPVKVPKICKVEICDRTLTPPYGHGMCTMHYNRWKRHGDPHYVRQPVTGVDECEITGCDKLMLARGWCAAHWTRWKRYGSPTARVRGEILDGKRVCPTCLTDKPLDEFFTHGRGGPCRVCAALYAVEWKKQNPEKTRENSHRRRARIRQAFVENVEILVLMERDSGVCQICKLPVKASAVFPDPHFPTVDHVIPLARGGAHSYANTQIAHYACNSKKGARMPA